MQVRILQCAVVKECVLPKISEKRIHLDSKWFSAERDVARTKGVHLSNVIDFIEHKQGKKEYPAGEGLSNAGNAYASGGFLWERVLSNIIERSPIELWEWMFGRALSEPTNPVVVRPGEQCMDGGQCSVCLGRGYLADDVDSPVYECDACAGIGYIQIFLTPDGLNIETNQVEEWKYTSKGWYDGCITDKKFRRWINYQIPAYLKSLNLNTCLLRVYFVRGDYKSPEPMWMEYTLQYTQQEIDETWDSIVQHAQILIRERHGKLHS